jgi:prolipoprotein diacylglyceryltransferase
MAARCRATPASFTRRAGRSGAGGDPDPAVLEERRALAPGLLSGIFVGGYGVARFCVEYFREPDRQLEDFAHATGMSMGQWLCVPMIVLGLVLVVRALRRPAVGSAVGAPAVA